ncbi:MAG TPA: MOSC N-terminal beta barrel domain-containing protein, partial [Casimicrobiaceae bacterium]|nr:MOSC N-terminal beta barrel domain-containing protein [Casimicrobiaceae bacterium]
MPSVTVAALAVHPVKSCGAVPVTEATVATTGLAHAGVRDREWMVVDALGRFVTQREVPRMALVAPVLDDGKLALRVPGFAPVALGAHGASRDVVVWRSHVRGLDAGDDAARALSAFLGRDVRLVRFDDEKPRRCNPDYVGTSGATTLFADGYPILVVGQASLDDLNARLAARALPPVPMDRFRPNVVVAGLEPYDEDHVDTLTFGDLVLKPVKPCTRCEITTTDQASARRGVEPLRTLATYRRDDRLAGVTFGMNAIVVAGAG